MDGDFFEGGLFDENPLGEMQEDAASQQKKIENGAKALRDKIRSVFSGKDGKEVSDFIIYGLCNCSRPVFNSDSLVMARDAGKQAVGFLLREILESEE